MFKWNQQINAIKPGTIAGGQHSAGYIRITIDGEIYVAHRLVYFYRTGEWPNGYVKHHNGIKNDYRWSNLYLTDTRTG